MMDQFFNFLMDIAGTYTGFEGGLFGGLEWPSQVLIIILVLFGTSYIGRVTHREEFLDYCLTFIALMFGAITANRLLGLFVVPTVTSELALVAITSNIGLAVAGLILVVVFRRHEGKNKM